MSPSDDADDSRSGVELLATVGVRTVEATASAAPGPEADQYEFHSFGAHFCEVRVNRYTGEPRVTRFTTVVDVGRVVDAQATRSQLVGGVITPPESGCTTCPSPSTSCCERVVAVSGQGGGRRKMAGPRGQSQARFLSVPRWPLGHRCRPSECRRCD
ncbi:molybdopterin cofactor-binding domain-containing protein [Streptomyces aurantiacus]|uniref:Aldehyde oxidase/xanthine dehydrogenase second molybdopterin binding domain-containing protein n=2 Tax=Streptomyces aurantiacus TaxID=47760 RepID=A0A7G1NYR0_9ACTN|nr:molybdopterin cofactor-binding domain-containing protein [Streptomyces aurantiacus]BCL26774.1 hypothetical protein GCM10017557_16330 [Streptomyces aurantiacus]